MRDIYKTIQKNILLLADMYGLYLSLLLLVWFVTGERFFFTSILVNIMPVIFIFIPLVFLITIWTRSKHTALLLLIPSITFIVLYAPAFFPPEISPGNGTQLNTLTFNVNIANTNTDALERVLREADADIIALQEVNATMANYIETTWLEEYPHQLRITIDDDGVYSSSLDPPTGVYTNYASGMIISRYPITNQGLVETRSLESLQMWAEIIVDEDKIKVYNIHLPLPVSPGNFFNAPKRLRVMEQILATANTEHIIIMGDFNATDQSSIYYRMRENYHDAFRESQAGFGMTFPNSSDRVAFTRIDYIFSSEHLIPQSARLISDITSDHLPVVARLVLQ